MQKNLTFFIDDIEQLKLGVKDEVLLSHLKMYSLYVYNVIIHLYEYEYLILK